nr:MAG TPA: hypothetical protein [Caudoviricetes sp.]
MVMSVDVNIAMLFTHYVVYNTEGYRLSSHLFPLFVWSQIAKAMPITVMSVDVNIAILFAH